jgi:PEP-CTERM motif
MAPSAVLAVPIPISGSNGLNSLGSFTGSFDYTPIDATHGTVDIVLNNTSATLGYITAFVFNLPDGSTVSAAPLDSSDDDFDLGQLGGPTFNNSENGSPFGQFDIGGSTGGGFQGGGMPSLGIASGFGASFSFALTGTGLGALTPASFLSTLSVGPGDGAGNTAFLVRFRGFDEGAGSDHVPLDNGAPIPEPGTMILLGLGLATLSARRLNSRKP